MSKYRAHRANHSKQDSKWNLPGSRRRSMSLHDVTATPAESEFESGSLAQAPSLHTLDSIHKSRDSGLSRSASRLSFASCGPPTAEHTPRTAALCDQCDHSCALHVQVLNLQKIIREKNDQLEEKDRDIEEWQNLYRSLLSEHQSLNLKFAEYQNEVDRFRFELYSTKVVPQNFFSNKQRSKSTDALSSYDYGHHLLGEEPIVTPVKEDDRFLSHRSPSSHTESSVTIIANNTVNTSGTDSGDEASDLAGSVRLPCYKSVTAGPRPVPAGSSRSSSISSAASHVSPISKPLTIEVAAAPASVSSWCAEPLSPVPSSKWTLDKSMQLVSDSEMSETEGRSPTINSKSTMETPVPCTPPSKISHLMARFEAKRIPSPVERVKPIVLKLPQETAVQKVQNWREEHWSTWKESKKRPQNLPVVLGGNLNSLSATTLQRLRSPQNLSLLSPRPFQLYASGSPPAVPPLDLTALHSDSENSPAATNTASKTPQSGDNFTRKPRPRSIHVPSQQAYDEMLRKAEKNMHLSRAVMYDLKQGPHSQNN